jgi:hypothetical protein
MIALAIALAIATATATPAAAFENMNWAYEAEPVAKVQHVSHVAKKRTYRKAVKRKSRVYKPLNQTRVLAFEHRDEPPRPVCAGPVRGVGEQYVSEAGAVDRAIKAWQETVRYDLGEGYMDTKNAEDIQFRCTRSSIGEIAGQTFQRCEWQARPCRPMLTNGTAQ